MLVGLFFLKSKLIEMEETSFNLVAHIGMNYTVTYVIVWFVLFSKKILRKDGRFSLVIIRKDMEFYMS